MRFTYKLIIKVWLNVRNPKDENPGLAMEGLSPKEEKCDWKPEGTIVM